MRQLNLVMVAAFGSVAVVFSPIVRAEEAPAAPVEQPKEGETPAPADSAKAEEPKVDDPAQQPVASPVAVEAEQPKVEEIKALETQAADAKEKVQEVQGFQEVGSSTQSISTRVAASDAKNKSTGFTARVILDHSVGAGTFIENDALGKSSRYVAQSWDLRPGYKFEFMGHTLKVAGRFLFDTEFTTPNNATGRRWTPADSSVTLSDPEIYTEPLTGLKLSGSVNWLFPTSYESINVYTRWGGAGVGLTLDRSIGPVDLSYSVGFRKFFNDSMIAVQAVDASAGRSNDPIRSKDAATLHVPMGSPNTSFDLRNTISVGYNVTEQLSVSYSLLFWNNWHYLREAAAVRNAETSQHADVGRQRGLDMLWPSFSVDFDGSSLLKAVTDAPVTVGLSLGISALHPAQTSDQKSIIWPTFYHSFAENRAANNYGSISFSIDGTY